MTTVYELIKDICLVKEISMRQLAINANIPPSTLISMMTRRPPLIAKKTLYSIGRVFNLNWYDLITLPENVRPETIIKQKVTTNLARNQKDRVLELIAQANICSPENQVPPQTNLDFMRNHSTEEVAAFLADAFYDGHGYKLILGWLQQKYEGVLK